MTTYQDAIARRHHINVMKAHSHFSNKHKLKDFPFDELKIQGILCNFYFVMCQEINKENPLSCTQQYQCLLKNNDANLITVKPQNKQKLPYLWSEFK